MCCCCAGDGKERVVDILETVGERIGKLGSSTHEGSGCLDLIHAQQEGLDKWGASGRHRASRRTCLASTSTEKPTQLQHRDAARSFGAQTQLRPGHLKHGPSLPFESHPPLVSLTYERHHTVPVDYGGDLANNSPDRVRKAALDPSH
ncbi:MAG: hypothetical protein NVSMB48_18970 [Marmoricola sp.]